MQEVINDPIRQPQAVTERQWADGHTFSGTAINVATQLQYAQMTVLNFEILKLLPARHVNLGWPHISVATLSKALP
jgi:hypothetical protein